MIKRKQGVFGAAILLGGIVLAGCGTSGHPIASAPRHRHHSQAVSPATAASPATSSTTPSSSPAPSPTSSLTTFVPGLGNLPTASLSDSGISVKIQHVYVVGQLIVNGQPINPPNAQAEPTVVEIIITAQKNGVILPVPNFGFATTNAIAAPSPLGQVVYFGAGQDKLWSQYQVPDQGVAPRLVLGDNAYPFWVITWIERPTIGNAHVAILWKGTASGKPGGVIATISAQTVASFSLTTH